MSINITTIRSLAIEELVEQLQDAGVDNAGNFSAAELVFELACHRSNGQNIQIEGILEDFHLPWKEMNFHDHPNGKLG